MRNHKLLVVCLFLATASMVGVTLWAEDMGNSAANMSSNMMNNAANLSANAMNNASNLAANMANSADNLAANASGNNAGGPVSRFREVNDHLTQAIQALDDAKKAEEGGAKNQDVLTKIATARTHLVTAQDQMSSWHRRMFTGRDMGNNAANATDNNVSNSSSNMSGNMSGNMP